MTTAKLHPQDPPRITGAEIAAWVIFGIGVAIALLASGSTTLLTLGALLAAAALAPALTLTGLRLLVRNARDFLAREVNRPEPAAKE